MRKFFFISLAIILLEFKCYSQSVVFDPAVVSTLVVNHQAQQEALKDIKSNESQIATAQKVIAVQMEAIKELERKMYNSLKDVASVIRSSKDIIYASKIAKDIGVYQSMMIHLAGEDPLLGAIAVKTEVALINRTADLFTYIYTTAVVGGDVNLMNNKARLDLIKHVVTELRVMRGIAYSITRKMRVAKRAGIMKTLNPFNMNYPNNGKAIAESLIEDFKKRK